MTGATTAAAERKRRRDFEQNRGAILIAADAVFTEFGIAASIAKVAERAGVGPATVYRHFPNKESLVEAVFEVRVVAYAEAVEATQQLADPGDAFRQAIHAVVELQARDRSFREIVSLRNADPLEDEALMRFGAAFLGALNRAREAGVLRDDVADTDVMLLLIASEGIARPAGRHSPQALGRLVDLVLDGVCNARTKLDGTPFTYDQVLDISNG